MTVSNAKEENIRAGRVEGTPVFSTNGEYLGTVEDLVIGKRDGRVKYAIMSFGGFLGIGEEYHPLPWDMLDYDEAQKGYIVPVTKEQLAGAPRFSARSEPDWQDEDYHRDVHGFYDRSR